MATVPKVVSGTPAEQAIVKELREKREQRPLPRMKVGTVDGKPAIVVEHQNEQVGAHLVMHALGTTSADFANGLLGQLKPLCAYGDWISECDLNFMIAAIKGVAPRDEAEAMLATQMAIFHKLTSVTAKQMWHAQGPQQDVVCTRLNKFARTFAALAEALKKYRSGGEQTIKVQHVTVNDGGQAIVGNVAPGARGGIAKPEVQSHALGHAAGSTVRSENEARQLVPSAGDAERALPDARGQGGGTEGQPEPVAARALHREGDRDAKGSCRSNAGDANTVRPHGELIAASGP